MGSVRALDVQGLGGSPALGAVQAGFDLVGVKTLAGFGVNNLLENRHILPGPWEVEASRDGSWRPEERVAFVTGCPPCSGFSLLNSAKTAARRGAESTINECMWHLARYAAECTGFDGRQGPEFVAFESVQQAFTNGRGLMRSLRDAIAVRTSQHYTLTHVLVSGATLGAAQVRKRYFFLAHRVPFGVRVPRVTKVTTVKDAIGDLENQPLAEGWHPYTRNVGLTTYQKAHRSETGTVRDHQRPVNGHVLRMESLARVPGLWQPGEPEKVVLRKYWDQHKTVPTEWQDHLERLGYEKLMISWMYECRRLRADKCGPVIGGSGGYGYIHYNQDRILTVREVSRLMGFPDDWSWAGAKNMAEAFLWSGKQVPVQNTRWLSQQVMSSMAGDLDGAWTGEPVSEDDERVVNITYDFKEVYDEKTGERRDSRSIAWRRQMAQRDALRLRALPV